MGGEASRDMSSGRSHERMASADRRGGLATARRQAVGPSGKPAITCPPAAAAKPGSLACRNRTGASASGRRGKTRDTSMSEWDTPPPSRPAHSHVNHSFQHDNQR